MGTQVEARSLSSINHVAAHPPQYPVNPTESHETLCLYISRVPGTRDVILSTFKPQQQSVTGEDVASALYYIHLDTPEDTMMAAKAHAANDATAATGRRSMESTRLERRITRKPLPASSRVVSQQTSPVDTKNPVDNEIRPSAPLTQLPSRRENAPVDNKTFPSAPLTQFPGRRENAPCEDGTGENARAVMGDQSEATGLARGPSIATVPIIRKPVGPRAPAATEEHTHDPPPPYSITHSPVELSDPQAASPNTPVELSDPQAASSPTTELQPALRPAAPLRLATMPPLPSTDLPPTHADIYPPQRSPLSPSRTPSPWSKHATHYAALPPPPAQSRAAPAFIPFSLTLIRRDPGTGHQWNIGKVSSFQSNLSATTSPEGAEVPAPVQQQHGVGYPAINIHIETSGYARFRDFPAVVPPTGRSSGDAARDMKELAAQMFVAHKQQQAQQQEQDSHEQRDDAEGGFTRQVTMAYGKSWTRNLKEAFQGTKTSIAPNKGGGRATRERSSTNASAMSADLDQPLEPPHAGFASHRRNDSGASSTTGSDREASHFSPPQRQAQHQAHEMPHAELSYGAIAPPPPPNANLRAKGYTFMSPWGGACDFRTTSNGRALKCRHTRTTTSQGFNPLVAAQALRDAATIGTAGGGGGRKRGMSASLVGAGGVGGSVGSKADVSELRFNLPATDLFHSKEDRERAAREVKRGLKEVLKSPGGYEQVRFDEYGDEIIDEGEGNGPVFDWSALGREKAGGGNRGKRAKLGKLLIYDEGIKMLDLVVAANMGIWWTAWERNF